MHTIAGEVIWSQKCEDNPPGTDGLSYPSDGSGAITGAIKPLSRVLTLKIRLIFSLKIFSLSGGDIL